MTTLAITGGIGSGKSTVAGMFAAKPGVRVVNADDEARRLMAEEESLRAALVARFGPDTFLPGGTLDRAGLAARVFGDREELLALNALVHPVVREALLRSIEEAMQDGIELFVYDVALITEIGVANIVDSVLLIDAPLETRASRAMARDGLSRNEVLARAEQQASPDDVRGLADYVIENDGDKDVLQRAVDALYPALLTN